MDVNKKMKDCSIVFNNDVYYAGDTVSGKVSLTLNKPKKYLGIVLVAEGFTETRWTHSSGKSKTAYSGREDYFTYNFNLIQPVPSEIAQEFTPGIHVFQFSFALPINIPSSIDGPYGRTCYKVKVFMRQPHKSTIDYCKSYVSVLSVLNLNLLQDVSAPYSVTTSNNFYFVLSKGTCHVTIEVPRTGFACGETVPIKCIVNNHSSVKVEQLKTSLNQGVTYISQNPREVTRYVKSKILCGLTEGVQENSEEVKDIHIPIPSLPATSLTSCSIIEIKYFFEVKVSMAGIHEDMRCKFPIVIGTIPLENQQLNSFASKYHSQFSESMSS